jgi:ankyrin repeat protein
MVKRSLSVYDAFGCALDGDAKRLCMYASLGMKLNELHPVTGTTLLHTAILGRQEHAVSLLLRAGADPNTRSEGGETPLLAAVRAGMRASVWDLVHMGADVNMSCPLSDDDDADSDADSDADIGASENEEEDDASDFVDQEQEEITPLMAAIETDDESMVQAVLLAAGVDVNRTARPHDKTALHHAAFYGNVTIVSLLIMHGAHVDAVDLDGATPLCYAALENNTAVMRCLLLHGAAMHGSGAWAPLHAAATRNQTQAMVMLLARGHDVNVLDDMGFNALTLAAGAGHSAAVVLLLHAGCTVQWQHASSWNRTQANMIRCYVKKQF